MIDIINYGVRIIILLIGIAFLTGILNLTPDDDYTRYAMGTVFTLFGIYRLIIYYSVKKRNELEDQIDKNS